MNELDKPLRRKTHTPFMHYRKKIVVELCCRATSCAFSAQSIEISKLYYELVKRRVAARKLERQKAKQQLKRKKS